MHLKQILRNVNSRQALVCMFLAMLEMVRLQAIVLMQSQNFGEIRLRKHKMFDTIFAADGSIAPMKEIDEQYL